MKTRKAQSFLQRLAASRLIEPTRLAQIRTALGDDESAVADSCVRHGLLTRFQVHHLQLGGRHFHVDKYIVVDYLGRGSNSLIFKARHTWWPSRFVALKAFDDRNLHRSPDALARFRREIDILGQLEHPNIVRALDVVHTRRQIYLVLELIAGRDLASVVQQRGPLPVGEAVGYAIQAALGLACAHEHGIVHRDLKPANLLLTCDGIVKVADLGLARFLEAGPSTELTLKGRCLGTPEFMAPEQAEDATEADVRSDIYSLGATLFYLLTAELPLEGSNSAQRLQRLLTAPPRSLLQARPDAPAALVQIVDAMRARLPQKRPGTATEVIDLLRPFARRGAVAEPPRWHNQSRAALIVSILRGEMDLPEAAARHGLATEVLERWRLRFLEGAEQALDPALPEDQSFTEYLRDLHARLGRQAMLIERLR
jgi:serine/threonine-protein kinase